MRRPGSEEGSLVRERVVSAVWGLVATVASAGLVTLAFPPFDLAPIAWVGLAPLLVAVRGGGVARAVWLGLLWSEVYFFLLIDSMPPGVAEYFERGALASWGLAAGLFVANGGLYYAAGLAAYRWLAGHYRLSLPLLAGAAWCAAELGRGRLLNDVSMPLNMPMGLVAYSQVTWKPVIQIASLSGPYGVSFLVVAVNAALAESWLALRGRSGVGVRNAALGSAVVFVLALAAVVYGSNVLRAADTGSAGRSAVPVVVVQGDLELGSRWKPEFYGRNLDRYLQLTLTAFQLVKPRVVFWPEAALTFDVTDAPPFRELIGRVLAPAGSQLVAGGPRGGAPGDYYNSVFSLSPSGDVLAHYDKQFLFPLAEYAPIGAPDPAERDFGDFRYWTPGTVTSPLPTAAGAAGVLVCSEAMFPEVAAQRVRAGADYLFSPANDGWGRRSWTPWPKWGRLMLDMAVFRAVEQRRPLVRASTTGPSALVDAWGRVDAQTDTGGARVLVGAIEPRSGRTPYARVGDLFAVLCAASVLGAALLPLARFRR
ncbi:MAG: apolipoprotein N-acyltransferase [Deltaproteobacteria bacterium]|nr:apolipoprotein N-acyltransferase [Deltaproteobacteria bacterium]MBW2415263.1 apolipoprotein N-acyltransferase [Deltaproteobacteria bacterium]